MSAIKRIVLFKFKNETPGEKIDEIFTELGSLRNKIPGVMDFTCGAYSSSDCLNQGYSHAFIMTYKDAAARDNFGPHPEHQRVIGILGPHVEGVLAFDFPESQANGGCCK